jgi:hypothetical protein
MSTNTILILSHKLQGKPLAHIRDLLNSASADMENIWLTSRPDEKGECIKNLDLILMRNRIFLTENEEPPWKWFISVGNENTIVGDFFDDEIWPELLTSFGFMTVIFRDSVMVYIPAKWAMLLSDNAIKRAILETSHVLAESLSASKALILPDETSDCFIIMDDLQNGILFLDALDHLRQKCGSGQPNFDSITRSQGYLEIQR